MDNFIKSIDTALAKEQSDVLQTFVSKSDADGFQMDKSVSAVGKTFFVPSDPTNPSQYNTAIASAIADLTGLYAGLDGVSLSESSLDSINRGDLSRIQMETEKLEQALKVVAGIKGTSAAYTHHLQHNFSTDAGDPSYIPDEFSRLEVDEQTGCLTRPLALSISRIRSAAGSDMCKISVDGMLGISSEARNPVDQAVDGDQSSFWREVILSDAPITVNKKSVDWLSGTGYTSGAAVRLLFEFESLTPVSEISIRPLSDYPMEVLGVSWSSSSNSGDVNEPGILDVGGTDWTLGTGGWAESYPVAGAADITVPYEGEDGTACMKATFNGTKDARAVLTRSDITQLQQGGTYGISFKAKSGSGTGFVMIELLANDGLTTVARYSPTISGKWQEYFYIVTMPDSIGPVTIRVTTYDQSALWVDDLTFSTSCMSVNPTPVNSATGEIVIPLSQDYGQPIMARKVWITLCQPNYVLKQYSIPKWASEVEYIWAGASNDTDWATSVSPWRKKNESLPAGVARTSPLAEAAQRLGGKVKSMLAGLVNLAISSETDLINISKYEYVLGAWEIDLRYKDYAPRGCWVSKPLNLRGEIRQLTVIPDINPLEEDKVSIYVLPYSNSPVDLDNACKLGETWSVYFNPQTQEPGIVVSSDASIIPTSPKTGVKERFIGTDRYRKIQLADYPYTNFEKVWDIHNTVTSLTDSSDPNKHNSYDPNAVALTYVKSVTPPVINSVTGYNPVKVTMNLNGVVVPPDVIGKSAYTRYRVYRDDQMTEVTGDVISDKTVTGSTTAEVTRKVKVFRTCRNIARPDGSSPKVAIYRHAVAELTHTNDQLLDPTRYTVRWDSHLSSSTISSQSVTSANIIEINDDPAYTTDDYQYIAFYRTEESAAQMISDLVDPTGLDLDNRYVYQSVDANGESTAPTTITDLGLQSYPVTRNVTDYITGKVPVLREAVLEKTSPNYYPVYEYYTDESGNLIFASDLFEYGDNPAIIEVEYDTLGINPRILISYEDPSTGASTCSSPLVSGYTTLLNARK